MLEDVRGIIAEQLGKDLKVVSSPPRIDSVLHLPQQLLPGKQPLASSCLHGSRASTRLRVQPPRRVLCRALQDAAQLKQRHRLLISSMTVQVTADAKFVDLGADSLDTVGAALSPFLQSLHGCARSGWEAHRQYWHVAAELIDCWMAGRDNDGSGGDLRSAAR